IDARRHRNRRYRATASARRRAIARRARRATQQVLQDHRARAARAAFARAALVRRARDVEVRPDEILRELAEERGRGDRAAVTPRDVRHVREIALELLAVFLGERHVPRAVVDRRAAVDWLL